MASKSLAVRSLFYEERQKRGSSGLGVSFLLDFLTGMVLCKDTEIKKSNCLFYSTGSRVCICASAVVPAKAVTYYKCRLRKKTAFTQASLFKKVRS